jgi:hypothetical protein
MLPLVLPALFLEAAARSVVVAHALAAIVLIGSSTHNAVIAFGYVRGKYRVRLGRIYAATIAVSWGVTFSLGLLAYPTFRYAVRVLYLDRHEPWASNLFDLKENLAALGVPLVLCMLVLSRSLDPSSDRVLTRVYVAMAIVTCAIVWFDVVAGLLITLARGA